MNAVTEVMDELRRVLNERDQARDKYEALAVLVDGYRRERDEARADAQRWRESREERNDEANNIQRALNRAARERDEARAEVERLRAEAAPMNEHFTAGYRDGYRDAYRRGAEAMREACAREVHGFLVTCFDVPRIEEAVRALPIPEEK